MNDEYNNISSLLLKMEIEKRFFDFISSNNPFLNHYYYDYYSNNNNNNYNLYRTEFQNALLNYRNNIYPFNNYYCNNFNSYNESQFIHDTSILKEYEPIVPFSSENDVLCNFNKGTPTTTTGSLYEKKKLENKISINKLISNNMKTIQKKNTKKRNLKKIKIETKNETGKKNRGGNIKRKKRPNHPPEVINILKKWLQENKDTYPYPSNTEKSKLCELTGLSLINNWFINARRRYI
ncbi:hypothetical protein U3516DRAFT_803420 [Neocallimastix sp. 'constans']